jgi:hypothetical protein
MSCFLLLRRWLAVHDASAEQMSKSIAMEATCDERLEVFVFCHPPIGSPAAVANIAFWLSGSSRNFLV